MISPAAPHCHHLLRHLCVWCESAHVDPLSRCASTSHPNASSGHVWTESGRVGTHTAHSAATGRCAEPAEREASRALLPQVSYFLKSHTRVVRAVLVTMFLWPYSVSQSVITTLLPTEHMVHYTRSVLYECVAESQSQGGLRGVGICQPVRFSSSCRGAWSAPRLAAMRRWRRWCAPPRHAGGAPRDGT